MPTPSLVRVRCLDADRAVGLVNYADMVVYDQEKNVVALRIGGYPETVQAMSDAILGGCELELTGSKSSLCLNSKGRRNYARRISTRRRVRRGNPLASGRFPAIPGRRTG